jgi:hypothetical protein
MKKIFIVMIVLFSAIALKSKAQVYSLSSVDGPSQKWVNMGTLSLAQGGNDCLIRIIGGWGYNAFFYQQGRIELHMRTSNGMSVDANNYAFSATAISTERTQITSVIKIIPNVAGLSATSYTIYFLRNEWIGGSYFSVETAAGTFTPAITASDTDPGTGYVVPFEFNVNSDSYFMKKVGIGTASPAAKLHIFNSYDLSTTTGLQMFYQGSWGTAAYASNFRFIDISSAEGGKILQANGYGMGIGFDPPAYASADKLYVNGNVGIGTTSPAEILDVKGNPVFGTSQERVSVGSGSFGFNRRVIDGSIYNNSLFAYQFQHSGSSNQASDNLSLQVYSPDGSNITANALAINGFGNVGIGTASPSAKLHISNNGSSSSPTSPYSGDLIIQGNPGNRTSTTGASLEFVIPANTDGSNPWGQARIIAVAGSSNTYNATGKMILGTRRSFDKGTGSGTAWNYGDDVVIDGAGNVGIGTTTVPLGYKMAVAGNAIAESITVKLQANWPDYAFKKNYGLMPLTDLKAYVDKNQHLPEVPTAEQVKKDGINLGEMNTLLMKKVEELTLYLIEKDKQDKIRQQEIEELKKQVEALTKTARNHN